MGDAPVRAKTLMPADQRHGVTGHVTRRDLIPLRARAKH
jgi:hypothetical protein